MLSRLALRPRFRVPLAVRCLSVPTPVGSTSEDTTSKPAPPHVLASLYDDLKQPLLFTALGSLPLTKLTIALAEEGASGAAAAAAAGAGAAGASVPPALATFLSVAPPACFFFLQISGLKTVKQIQKEKTTGNLSILPFLSLATNCIVWSTYGALLSDPTVFFPNLTGAVLGIYYTRVYAQYSPSSVALPILGAAGIVGGVASLALTQPVADAAPLIGYTGCTLAVILMASPLATMATVLREKSTASMPFVTSVATFFNALSWASYGIFVAHNPIIWGPNMLGLAATLVQLGLFGKFGIQSSKE